MKTAFWKVRTLGGWFIAIVAGVWGLLVGGAALWPVFTTKTLPEWLSAGGWQKLAVVFGTLPMLGVAIALSALSVVQIVMLVNAVKAANPPQQAKSLDYRKDAPKVFTLHTVDQFFDIGRDQNRTGRQKKAELSPHIGLWLNVSGRISQIENEGGDDGEGGQWAHATINFASDTKLLDMPRLVQLWFLGADAAAIRASLEGDFVEANGRIERLDTGVLGAIHLLPCELVRRWRNGAHDTNTTEQ